MRKLTYFLLCLFMYIGLANAQTTQITGSVVSAEDGEPVIGASIIVKGTNIGTVTNFDGTFSLEAPESAKTLMISYIGMKTQEAAIKSVMNIKLDPDAQNLDEVVVTALGISKEKKALGYAVQDVKADVLTQGSSTSLTGALQGKVSGLEITPSSGMPGASAKMTIRGSRSFTGDNTPLYVVDGMPIASTSDWSTGSSVSGSDNANRAVDIDPNDIESVNILKGQAASALYGMRASNGVVIITTKSGKNAKKGKPQINFSSNLSVDKAARLPKVQNTYSQGTNGKFNPNNANSWGCKISELPNDPTYGGNNFGHPGTYFVPQLANALGVTMDDPDAWVTPQVYDNIGDFFETGYAWSNSLNIQQANEKGHYSFSLGNTHQDGIVPGTGMNRYTAKLAAETQLHPNWTTGFSGNFTHSSIDKMPGANDGVTATVYLAPPSYNLAGIPDHAFGDLYTQTNYRPTSSFGNAYWQTSNNEYSEKNQRFFGNAYANYKTNLGTDNHTLNVKYVLGTDSYQTNYTAMTSYGHKSGQGALTYRGYTVTTINSLLTAAYSWNINEDLVFDALIGNEFIDKYRKYYIQQGNNFNFSGWNHMNNAGVYTNEEYHTRNRTVGFFGNLSLAYRNMLFLNVTGRNDYVSTMPTGNHSFFYPSVSAGFILTELDALKNEILTYAKVRGSYAEVGMAGEYYPDYYTKGTFGGGFLSGINIAYPVNGQIGYNKYTVAYDPNLKPQNTRSYEFGADLTFMDGLFSLNYTFSRQNVTDQIFAVPLASTTGMDSFYTNGGKVHTNAHEITLSVNPIRKKNVDWTFAFNFSKVDNYVDELADGVENIFLGGFTTPNVRAMVGEKYPVVYGTIYKRDDNGNLVLDDKGMPQAGGSGVIARCSPDFQLGFNTSLNIYKFRFSATLDWKQGGEMYAATNALMDQMGVSKQSGEDRDRGYATTTGVQLTGTDANGNPTYSAVKDFRIESEDLQTYYSKKYSADEGLCSGNSFVKLREISLGYPVIKNNALELNVNVFARNILIWSELENFDPETSQGNSNMSGTFERYSLPQTSSYGFGFNLKF
ncbi:SusC/RagA family TonB-linked outer membrane protein [Parabacteroides sp.]|uniref:SusC/RagA family TonB-linked outer membrane protein n=1 Tax=Parabacteroides sp. TaxID=1869337 RepID=UPI0026E0EEE4|nr:SusC/RagA family TonB-linked outer membrane protein [Parabacteroides sp.]MDO5429871.1 SusC/RagA family TonB-linked outer membrane protein [Parabacteroides sp.]